MLALRGFLESGLSKLELFFIFGVGGVSDVLHRKYRETQSSQEALRRVAAGPLGPGECF